MDKVKVKRDELLEIVLVNRNGHQAIFEEAVAGYKALAMAQLRKHLKDVERGAMQVISIMMPAPVNYTKEYDRIVKMLEMEQREELDLTEADFRAWVMDDFGWKQQFLASNSTYSATAASNLGSQ